MRSYQDFVDVINQEQLVQSVLEDFADVLPSRLGNQSEELTEQRIRDCFAVSILTVNSILGLYHEWLAAQIEQQA